MSWEEKNAETMSQIRAPWRCFLFHTHNLQTSKLSYQRSISSSSHSFLSSVFDLRQSQNNSLEVNIECQFFLSAHCSMPQRDLVVVSSISSREDVHSCYMPCLALFPFPALLSPWCAQNPSSTQMFVPNPPMRELKLRQKSMPDGQIKNLKSKIRLQTKILSDQEEVIL